MATDLFREATASGDLVATRRLDPADVPQALAGWETVLRHERIPFVSYPYEWPFEMLRDAARLQLDLTLRALDEDLVTKDASAYNVQFVGAHPTFIDIGSFERLVADEPWYGYRQFCQLFLYPLMLQAHRDIPFQPWLRGRIGGISPIEARAALSLWDLRHRGTKVHVALHARAERRYGSTERDVKDELRKAGYKKELTVAQVKGLARVVDGIRWKAGESEWSAYGERGHYTEEDLAAKAAFVGRVTATRPRATVVDLGANDGWFSRVALEAGAAYVVAVDGDPLVVDTLYRSLREEGERRILPLTMDLADPSPSTGWRGVERPSFLDRCDADLVLALAVVHHLAISANVPLGSVLDMIGQVGREAVVEFPRREDPMVQRLLRNKRDGVHDDYSLEAFESEIAARFDVVVREEVGTRVLFHLVPADG